MRSGSLEDGKHGCTHEMPLRKADGELGAGLHEMPRQAAAAEETMGLPEFAGLVERLEAGLPAGDRVR